MINLWLVVFVAPAVFVSRYVIGWLSAMSQARQFQKAATLPCVVTWTGRDDMLFWMISPWLVPIVDRFPFGLGRWIHFVKKDNIWIDKKYAPREQLGSDLYWTVGPGHSSPAEATLWISDADVIAEVVHRWKDFPKAIEYYSTLDIYGPNVVTTEGSTWQKHRKITGPPFNERNSGLVFQETIAQGKSMVSSFTHDAEGKPSIAGREPVVADLAHWVLKFALNVISGAGFDIHIPWSTHSVEAGDLETTSASAIQRSIPILMENLPILILSPWWMLRWSPFRIQQQVYRASNEFVAYMHEIFSGHQAESTMNKSAANSKFNEKHGSGGASGGDLLNNIVRAATAEKDGLSIDEVIGNMYILIIAGHETSGNTIETALILLAAQTEIQQDVQKEIDDICANKATDEEFTYDDYPRMRAIVSVMLETLRLYPPVITPPKCTRTPQTIVYKNQTISIPGNSGINLDIVSVQRHPAYWGPDPHTFRPSRWLMPSSYTPPQNTNNESPGHSNLLYPPKGAFMAFSSGFRACLGRKFAHVEFCALIAVLLRDYSIELVGEAGESFEVASQRAVRIVDDRSTTAAMRINKKMKVRFVRRGAESFPPRT